MTAGPRFAKFMRLYWTKLLPDENVRVVADPVRIEVFRGPRQYKILIPGAPRVIALGQPVSAPVVITQTLEFPKDQTYIELTVDTDKEIGQREYCEHQIDRIVTQLSAILSPKLFDAEVWRGWLANHGVGYVNSRFIVVQPVTFNPNDLENQIEGFKTTLAAKHDVDERRFSLMSKLFSRALGMEFGEERFLWLWTVLEVFPMKATTDIQPISDYLSRVTGRSVDEVKAKLDLGRLFGARSILVHDGTLPYTGSELDRVLGKLESIVRVVIRSVGGLPYTGELDSFIA
jgi:hypothetical protein